MTFLPGQQTDRRQLSWALRGLLASMILLLLVTYFLIIRDRPHQPPYAQVLASRSSADVTLFYGLNTHGFEVHFHREVGNPQNCWQGDLCLEWSDSTRLEVRKSFGEMRTVTAWAGGPVSLCFPLHGAVLYGGPSPHRFPSIITTQPKPMPGPERIWYSSSGLNLKVSSKVPLFVTQDERKLCLIANNTHPYPSDTPIFLSYETCGHRSNLREAVNCFFKSFSTLPPPTAVIAHPSWSTKDHLEEKFSPEGVLNFVKEIKEKNFGIGEIEIDGNWENCYGTLEFNRDLFPDPKAMVDNLHSQGILVTLKTYPHTISPGCRTSATNVINVEEDTPYQTSWSLDDSSSGKEENGAVPKNFSVYAAVLWYVSRLVRLKKTFYIDSFKFDLQNPFWKENDQMRENQTYWNYYYINPPPLIGFFKKEEHLIPLTRLVGTQAKWGAEERGLKSILPLVLYLSIEGHQLVETGPVRGDTSELFIRWLQLNTFFPFLYFSVPPWVFDNKTVEISRNFTLLRNRYKEKIEAAIRDPQSPVISPISWLAPNDHVAHEMTNEFLLGTDLLVAPVLDEGVEVRDVYLPKGKWLDGNSGNIVIGPAVLQNYCAPLEILPFFERVPT